MANNEIQRLLSVRRFDTYQFDIDKGLEGIVTLAAEVCKTPVAFLTIIDEDTQWFRVSKGMKVFDMPRKASFCTHTIMDTKVLVVPDPTQDERFSKIPLVVMEPHIRFYAGAPLTTEDGQNIGTLCVFDGQPRQLTDDVVGMMGILAQQAIHLMELELCLQLIKHKNNQIELQNRALVDIAFTQSHEFRGPLSTAMGFMQIIRDDDYNPEREHLMMMEEALLKLDLKIHEVVRTTQVAKSAVETGRA